MPSRVLIWRKMSLESWSRECVEYTRVVTLTNRQIPIYKIQPDERNSPENSSRKLYQISRPCYFPIFRFHSVQAASGSKTASIDVFFLFLTSAILKYFNDFARQKYFAAGALCSFPIVLPLQCYKNFRILSFEFLVKDYDGIRDWN